MYITVILGLAIVGLLHIVFLRTLFDYIGILYLKALAAAAVLFLW